MQQHAACWEEEMIERELNSHTLILWSARQDVGVRVFIQLKYDAKAMPS
jgi:hypothetical protein